MTRAEVIEIQSSITRNFGEINTDSPHKKHREDSRLVCGILCMLDAFLSSGRIRKEHLDTAVEWIDAVKEA